MFTEIKKLAKYGNVKNYVACQINVPMDTFNWFLGTGVHEDKFKDVINCLSELEYKFLMYWHSSKVHLIERYSMDI